MPLWLMSETLSGPPPVVVQATQLAVMNAPAPQGVVHRLEDPRRRCDRGCGNRLAHGRTADRIAEDGRALRSIGGRRGRSGWAAAGLGGSRWREAGEYGPGRGRDGQGVNPSCET